MKNWAAVVACCGVIIVAIAAFLFIKKSNNNQVQNVLSSPQLSPKMAESSGSAMKKTYSQAPSPLPAAQIEKKRARIKTAKGDIVFEFYADAPLAASNFIFLTNDNFYNGLTFHRRVEGFVIQGGDPNGNGTGGPGYKFNDEKVIRDYKRGTVAMANSGPNTNGSQFFVMLADNPLPKQYTIFGNVVLGLDVVDKIQVGDVMEKITIE